MICVPHDLLYLAATAAALVVLCAVWAWRESDDGGGD